MAGCTFDSNNYVAPYCSGYAVVVNGAYVGAGADGTCNGSPIYSSLTAAQNAYNLASGCGGGGGCGSCSASCHTGTCPAGQSCQNGVCAAGTGGGGPCAQGSFSIMGTCVPQTTLLVIAGLGLILLRRH